MAKALELHYTSYLRYEQDQVMPADLVAKLVSLARVNPRWLAHGKGEMFLAGADPTPSANDAATLIADLWDEIDRLKTGKAADSTGKHGAAEVAISIYGGEIKGGMQPVAFRTAVSGELKFPSDMIPTPGVTVAIRAADAGMLPGIPEGSFAAVDVADRQVKASLVMIVAEGRGIIRQVSGGIATATAAGFAPMVVRPKDIIGRVVAVIAGFHGEVREGREERKRPGTIH